MCFTADGCCGVGYTGVELTRTAFDLQWSAELSGVVTVQPPAAKLTVLAGGDDEEEPSSRTSERVEITYAFHNYSGISY